MEIKYFLRTFSAGESKCRSEEYLEHFFGVSYTHSVM